MRTVIITLLTSLILVGRLMAQNPTVTGQVSDQSGRPIPFANVLILAATDSALVTGGVTDESGAFRLEAGPSAGLLKVSFIGFEDKYLPLTSGQANLGTITLREATEALAEVVVKGDRPVTRLKGDALVTTIENTFLSKIGSANDVLGQIPGVIQNDQDLEVLGRGKPLIYINGRQVREKSELEQLSANEIKNVELITNPGARYDATVKAVIRIRTARREGEGFGLNLRSSYYQSQNTDLIEQLDLNYRKRAVDLFAMVSYLRHARWADASIEQKNQVDHLWVQTNEEKQNSLYNRLQTTFGLNYQINDNHAIGVRYDWAGYPSFHKTAETESVVMLDGRFYDRWTGQTEEGQDLSPNHHLSAYYYGQLQNLNIEIDADYLRERSEAWATTLENSQELDDRTIRSVNPVDGWLAAGKALFSLPLGGGNLSWGGELTHTSRTDDYLSENEENVPTSYSEIREDNISVFTEYARKLPFGQLAVGLRYEHVSFDYWENHQHVPEQSRVYDNLFPDVSLSMPLGPVQARLGYAARTQRPAYNELGNNIVYINRFTLKQGDPALRPVITHDVNLTATWRYLRLIAGFQHHHDLFTTWGEPIEGQPEVTLIKPINLDKLPQLSLALAATPKFGPWSPTGTVGLVKQWLEIQSQDREYRLNKPIWYASLNNHFALPWGINLMVNLSFQGKGHEANSYRNKPLWIGDLFMSKSFLNDALSVELRGNDLFGQKWNSYVGYFNRLIVTECNKSDTREFRLTLRYKFNATKSRYKGTGAGKDAINRL